LIRLRDRIRGDAASVSTLERLHAIKNTMGYGLNAFLDYDEPVDILAHVVVGSEGTLALVAEATFRTVPLKTSVATGLLVFATLDEATAALPALVDTGFATIELMDAAALVLRNAMRTPPTICARCPSCSMRHSSWSSRRSRPRRSSTSSTRPRPSSLHCRCRARRS